MYSFFQLVNAAIIVDPFNGQIISKAQDEILPILTSPEENVSSNSTNEGTQSKWNNDQGVACVNPWGWLEKSCQDHAVTPYESGSTWHPLKHAAMVAIENAAARDRQLFLNSSPCGNNCYSEFDFDDGPAKRLKTEV
jgi:tRNA-specific adenosine deaminase 3